MYLAEHFVKAPEWTWLILAYFFLAGLSGGSYALGTMLRLFGRPSDEPAARFAFLISLPLLVLCPIFLTVDLGRPADFWHMLVNSATGGLNFKYLSPMSVGVWALGIFGVFSFLSFLDALVAARESDSGRRGAYRRLMGGMLGRLVMILGTVFGLFICAYTGVLLSVSNQPVWSDGWPLGGLFLASALSGSAALILLAMRYRAEMLPSVDGVTAADRYFVILEAALVVLFLITVFLAGTVAKLFAPVGILLWLFVLAGIAAPFLMHRQSPGRLSPIVSPLVVLVGVLALRAVIIFGAQS
ncbi:MAG TPA: NrfD/PsrC family molybdoenzyme membrane anchor subunit [Candidatus Dormibacteraeota bacterium]|jgi:formate-dependent nitrite reductase membrane component NrfD